VLVFNTHWDHVSAAANLRFARLIAAEIRRLAGSSPYVLTGDFNSGEATAPMATLRADLGVRDTFRVLFPTANDVGTFSGFELGNTKGDKIDAIYAIYANGRWRVDSAAILRYAHNGRYTSDHFPVVAKLTLLP
jgi:endonuclease/exonuclease/phosphatase family metal-dependent hydrolase